MQTKLSCEITLFFVPSQKKVRATKDHGKMFQSKPAASFCVIVHFQRQWTIPLKEAASLLWYFYRDPLRSLTSLSLSVLSQKLSDGFL